MKKTKQGNSRNKPRMPSKSRNSKKKAPAHKVSEKNQKAAVIEVRRITLNPSPITKLKSPLVGLSLFLVVAGLGFILFNTLKNGKAPKSSRASGAPISIPDKFTFERLGEIIPKGAYPVVRMGGDKKGNFYRLNRQKPSWQIQKYSPENRLLKEVTLDPSKGDFPSRLSDFTVDAQGNTYLLGRDGTIYIYNTSLAFTRTLSTKIADALEIDLDSKDRIFILGKKAKKVFVFSKKGEKELSFGSQSGGDQALQNPLLLTVTSDGRSIVLENGPKGMKASVYLASGKRDSRFSLSKIKHSRVLDMKIGPKNRMFFNNHRGLGIFVYDLKGNFLGRASKTDKRDYINHPGGVFTNKWTGDIFIDFAPGILRCRLS